MKTTGNIKNLFTGIILCLLIGFTCVSCSSKNPMDDPNNKAALEEIKKEPKVLDATITDSDVLYVSVIDDGTRRDGYASYLCEVLTEHNATTKWVKVVKAGSTNDPNKDNAYGVLLGESRCGK
jgi:hypothetical protein